MRLLLLLLAAPASVAEIPRPFTLLKSGCALADRSRLVAETGAAVACTPVVLERSMELATVGDAGAVYEPLVVVEVRSIDAKELANGVLTSVPDIDAMSGSLNVEARGVRGTGEG